MVKWNPKVNLILADVDETVADLYLPAAKEMIVELERVLGEGIAIFFITGHGLEGVRKRITDQIAPELRRKILIAHCSGVEVWGFNEKGDLLDKAYYSLYEEKVSAPQKIKWREIIQALISEFGLKTYPATPINQFKQVAGDDPLAIMLEDRGSQITFEIINGYDISPELAEKLEVAIPLTHGHYDLRIPILERAEVMLKNTGMPITPRLGGIFALDFAVEGVSKTTSVKHVLADANILKTLNLTSEDINKPDYIEIWGDRFSTIRGGSDRHMCEAVNPQVRAIDFRQENSDEFLPGYNIVVWDGKRHLHEGLLEYLQSRR